MDPLSSSSTPVKRKRCRSRVTAFPDVENIIDKVIVSQILNRVRTQLVSSTSNLDVGVLQQPVTAEFVAAQFLAESEVSHCSVANKKLHEVLSSIRFDCLQQEEPPFTVADALKFDADGFPHLAPETIAVLDDLSNRVVVGKEQIREVLEKDPILTGGGGNVGHRGRATGDDHRTVSDALDAVFPFDTRVIPGALLADFVAKVQRPVHKVRFSKPFVHDVVHSMRSLATSLPYVALILVFYILVAQLDLWGKFASYLNASTPNEPWSNYCEGGGVVNGSCFFHKRLIDDTISATETTQFLQYEIVADLWKYAAEAAAKKEAEAAAARVGNHSGNSSASTTTNATRIGAADIPFEGFWLVGALVMRVAPPRVPLATHAAVQLQPHVRWSCESLNLSVGFFEPRLGLTYDCSAYHAVVIPFSATIEEALALSSTFNLSAPAFLDACMLIQYAMLAPSTGHVTWVTLSLAMPKFGGFVQKVQLEIMDKSVHELIVVAFWFSLVIWILDVLSLLLFRSVGIGLTHNLGTFAFRSFLLGLIAASYYYQAQTQIPDLLTVDYVPIGVDSAVGSASFAVQLFSLWALFLLVLIVQFIAYLDGLKIIATLFSRIIPDVTGLLIVFGFLYVMFVMVAVILFGQTMAEYSSFYNSNLQLLQYFLLKFDLKRLVDNYPQTGFAFYFVFRVFIFYLVLNFFIVTIIAPIRSVWLEGDLPIAVNNVLAAKRSTAFLGSLRATLERYAIMAVDLFVGFIPITMPFWLKAARSLEDLYEPLSNVEPFLDACDFLLELRTKTAASAHRYRTARAATLPGLPLANYDASYHLCLLLLLAESNHSLLRDARAMRLLAAFDEFTTQTESGLTPPEDEKEVVLPPLDEDYDDEEDNDHSGSNSASDDEAVHHSEDDSSGAKHEATRTDGIQEAPLEDGTTRSKRSGAAEMYRQKCSLTHDDDDSHVGESQLQHPNRVSFEIGGGVEDNSQMETKNGGGGDKEEEEDDDDDSLHFHFTRFLLQEICDHRFFSDGFYLLFTFVDRCSIVVLFAMMLYHVNMMPRDIAFMSRNAHSGLRDLPYRQNCFDENCTNAFTKKWTYGDNLRLDHLRMYVERRLTPSLSRQHAAGSASSVPDLTGIGEAVSWDPYIVVEWPIHMRQLRAASTPCVVPPLPSELLGNTSREGLRRTQIASSRFCGTSQLETFGSNTTLERPVDSLLGPSAYVYLESGCPEADKAPIYGIRYPSIPCQGFIAEIANISQLEYAVRHWIDGVTRFVGITFTLVHRRPVVAAAPVSINATRLEYACYTEFSEGGSAGRFFTRTTPFEDEALDAVNRRGMRLMIADFTLGTLEVLIPILHCVYHRRWQKLAQQYFFSFRMGVFIAFLAFAVIDSNDVFVQWPKQAEAVILIIWLFLQMLFSVVFPFSQFFFRRVIIVNQFIRLTVLKVILLLPVFAIILSAFSLSGYLLWGGSLESFSTIHGSFRTISLGLLGDFDFYVLYDVSPTLSLGFTVLFLITVIIVLLNILLAVIAGCADESREDSQVIAPLEVIGHVMSRRVYFGPLIGVLLMWLLKEKQRSQPNPQMEEKKDSGEKDGRAGQEEPNSRHRHWRVLRGEGAGDDGDDGVASTIANTSLVAATPAAVPVIYSSHTPAPATTDDARRLVARGDVGAQSLLGQAALETSLPGSMAASTVVVEPEMPNNPSAGPASLLSSLLPQDLKRSAAASGIDDPMLPSSSTQRSAPIDGGNDGPQGQSQRRPLDGIVGEGVTAVSNASLQTKTRIRAGPTTLGPQTPVSGPQSPGSLYHKRRLSVPRFGAQGTLSEEEAARDSDSAAAGESTHSTLQTGSGAPTRMHGSVRQVVNRMFVVRRHESKLEVPRFHILENHRIPTPLECLLPRLGPALVSEVCHVLHLTSRPEAMQCSLVAYILAVHQNFQVVNPGWHAMDIMQDEEEQIQVLGAFHLEKAQRYALLRKSISASGGGHPHGGGSCAGVVRSPRPSSNIDDPFDAARRQQGDSLFVANGGGGSRTDLVSTSAFEATQPEGQRGNGTESRPLPHPMQQQAQHELASTHRDGSGSRSSFRRTSLDQSRLPTQFAGVGADGSSTLAKPAHIREAQKAASTWKRFAKRGIGRIAAFDDLLSGAAADELDEVQAITRTMSMASRRQSFTRGGPGGAVFDDAAGRVPRGGSFTRRTSAGSANGGNGNTPTEKAAALATEPQQPSASATVDA